MPDLDALAAIFDLSKLSRALTKFDPADIAALSRRILHEKPFEAVAETLAAMGIAGPKAEAFWVCVRGNLANLGRSQSLVGRGERGKDGIRTIVADEDRDFLKEAADLLPPDPLDETSWDAWIAAIKIKTGRKGKAIFMPLRLALTGADHGPELRALLPIMGSSLCSYRLRGTLGRGVPGGRGAASAGTLAAVAGFTSPGTFSVPLAMSLAFLGVTVSSSLRFSSFSSAGFSAAPQD